MKLIIKQGKTSQRLVVFIQDSSLTTGAGKTGLAFNSSGLVWYYWRDDAGNAGGTSVTLATATKGTWSTGGFIEIDSTNLPGFYEIGVPNAVLAATNTPQWAVMMLKGVTNMAVVTIEIMLVPWDPADSVRLGLTALPNAAAEASGGLYTRGSGAGQINQAANGNVDVNAVKMSSTSLTGRDIGASVLLSTGTGTGQLDFTSGVVKANATQWLGGTIPAVNVTGVPKVDIVDWLGVAPNALNAGRVDAIASIRSNTAQAGAAGTITLDASASATDNFYRYSFITITGGTGAGQTRLISSYVGSTKVASVLPNWATNPDNTSTFTIMPNGGSEVETWLGTVVTAATAGMPDVNVLKINSTSQTARDIGASVLLSSGSGTGQLDFTSGVVKANATQWLGGTIPAVNVTGVPKVDIVDWLGSAPNALKTGKVESTSGYVIRSGTAQGGANTNAYITLDAGASATDQRYSGHYLYIDGGTGVGQGGLIYNYQGSNKRASIAVPLLTWLTIPDNTSTFVIIPAPVAMVNGGLPDVNVYSYAGSALITTTNNIPDVNVLSIAAGLLFAKKNTSLTYSFGMYDSTTGELATGLTVSCTVSKDGGTFASSSGSVTEVATSSGVYKITLTSGEMNATQVFLKFTATGAKGSEISIITQA